MQNLHSDWKSRGKCVVEKIPAEIFFPFDGDKVGVEYAKSVCGECSVRGECREYAIQMRCEYGVFGGTTWKDRVKIIRSRYRAKV